MVCGEADSYVVACARDSAKHELCGSKRPAFALYLNLQENVCMPCVFASHAFRAHTHIYKLPKRPSIKVAKSEHTQNTEHSDSHSCHVRPKANRREAMNKRALSRNSKINDLEAHARRGHGKVWFGWARVRQRDHCK